MSFYIPATATSFQDNTLVLPSLTLGHVGQLALDAIITTLKLPKVGYIDEPNVLPTLSNDAFAADQGLLATSLEVFQSSEKKITILQQRAPVVRAYNAQYAASIVQWAKSAQFKEIVVLMSADATRRNDEQLVGTQFRFASTSNSHLRQRASDLKWIELEAETKDSIIRQGTIAQKLLEEGEKQGVSVTVVLLFCAEGNNVPDGLTMASHVNQYLKVKEPNPNPQVSEWLVPSSWSVLLEGPPIDRSLFMRIVADTVYFPIMEKGSEDRRICEEFVQLLERSQQLFAGLRDIPMFGKQWEPYFQRTFDTYTRLWKFQQQHRAVLENKERYGMERWEIGEIASKIGQLYYHYYLRTSETHYLEESFVFYEAIRARAYFKGVSKLSKPSIMVKQLRYFARFIVVCLLLGRHNIVDELVSELTTLVEEYIMLKPNDAQEWQLVVQEITLFLQADYPLRIKDSPNFVPYRRFPPQLLSSQPIASRLYLQNALLISNHQHQVKFSELTLDMFRINVSLEKELATLDKEMLGTNDFRPNPKKYLIYRPTNSQLLLHLASATKELKENGVMLFYISADGEKPQIPPLPMDLANSKYLPYSHGGLKLNSKEDETRERSSSIGSNGPSNDSPRGSLGSGPLDLYSSRDCLYPEDMMPFLRKPMVIIVDSDNASSFLNIPNTFGVPFMVLCSPRAQPPELLEASQAGNLFTFFLHDPLSAFCFVVAKTVFPLDIHKKCTECINSLFSDLASSLQSSSELPVNCARLIQDEFILVFFMRFLFCYAMFSTNVLFLPTPRQHLPACHPKLPKSLLLHPRVVAGIQQLASILGVSDRFKYPASVDLLVSKDDIK